MSSHFDVLFESLRVRDCSPRSADSVKWRAGMGENEGMTEPLVLSFDLDDTLWPVGPVIAGAESAMFSWLQHHYPRTVSGHSIESLRELRAGVGQRFPGQSHDMSFLRLRALQELFGAAGHAETLAEDAFEVFFAARNQVDFYQDVPPALARLRERYRLFALSNGNADLHRCGLAHLFAGHVTARSAGAAKPDARIFAQLLQEAGVEAHQVMHIGDDPLADVVGATQAGMQAVWINRDAREWPAQFARPSRTVKTLAEII
jgi:FMN hydrolase / 5-amino-6-(5-phospho-D-ribitylamino)uracil phosphatase